MKTTICAVCGKQVDRTGYTRNQKYCPECREKVRKDRERLRWRERKKERTEKGEWYDLETGDTPENIAICLSCTLKDCRMESAGCRRQ